MAGRRTRGAREWTTTQATHDAVEALARAQDRQQLANRVLTWSFWLLAGLTALTGGVLAG
jgi:hypothetical protein